MNKENVIIHLSYNILKLNNEITRKPIERIQTDGKQTIYFWMWNKAIKIMSPS